MPQECLTISTHHGDQSDKPSKTHPRVFLNQRNISQKFQYSLAVSSCGMLVWVKLPWSPQPNKLRFFVPPKSPSHCRDNQLQTQLCSLLGKASADLHKMRLAVSCATGFLQKKKGRKRNITKRRLNFPQGYCCSITSHGWTKASAIPWVSGGFLRKVSRNHPKQRSWGKKHMSMMSENYRLKIPGR